MAISRLCACALAPLLLAAAPAWALGTVYNNTLTDCQPVAPYTVADGALVCSGTLDANQQRFQLNFKVSGGTSVTDVRYTMAARHPIVMWFKGSSGRFVQANPLVNDYTLSIRGPASDANGTPLLDGTGNPYQFVAEQHFQLVRPLGISGPGAPVFEPLTGSGLRNAIGY